MGCDIHAYIESCNDDENWIFDFECESMGRNYNIFGKLAGVRCWDFPHYPVKGLPDIVSEHVWAEYTSWGSDAHTPSYLTQNEIIDFLCWLESSEDLFSDDYVKGIINEFNTALNSNVTIRLVFWFDN